MTLDIYYKEDLLDLTPQDIEECYGPFIDIDKVDSFGDTLLLAACRNKQIENVIHYLKLGANPDFINECGDFPLRVVIDTATYNESVSLEIIKLLINAGANLELRGYLNKTPFLIACCRGSLAVLKLLVKSGCDANATIEDSGEINDGEYFADLFNLQKELKEFIRNSRQV